MAERFKAMVMETQVLLSRTVLLRLSAGLISTKAMIKMLITVRTHRDDAGANFR